MSDIDSVRVAVRIRPLVRSEIDRGCQSIIDKVQDEPQVVFKNADSYTFNYVYGPDFTQEFLYQDSVQSMIGMLFKGYNVTILAYGQTGSGKTHTMGTAFDGVFGAETGVIPRAMYDIFNEINSMTDHDFNVTCSFMELYQEQLYDLLSTSSRDQSIVDIREDGNRGIIIPGLTQKLVTSAAETTDCLMKGSSGRAVGATAMNAQSSRSHAIFTISIQMMKIGDSDSSTNAKFHLVDLAGSERSKKTKATGDRFKEGVKINQGLLALGNVISALGSSHNNTFVGYRDSKLTRLLQDSLGGNSYTLMIACVSPADYNMDETLSTLRYADRARKIKNKPVVNQDPKAAEINRLNAIIQKLRLDLLSKSGRVSDNVAFPSQEMETMQKCIANMTEKNKNLQSQIHNLLMDVGDLEMRAMVAESAHDELYNKINDVSKMAYDLYANFNVESCSEDVVEYAKRFTEIHKAIEDICGILQKKKDEMIDHQQGLSSASSTLSLSSEEISSEAVQKKIDVFNQKQFQFKEQIRALDKQLGLKEALHQQMLANRMDMASYDDNSEEKSKELQSTIRILEAEKKELLDKLKSAKGNASAKISEERRIRLQQLEQQLSEMRNKNKQQGNLLKVREKAVEKVNNLTKEIQEMKAAKVKLVRQMRSESERYRQWKLERERELSKLREKDRKRQHEMVRMETMHAKKENVLKCKVADAMAANKRLKHLLEKHKTVLAHRQKTCSGKVENVISWIEHELELINSVIDAGNAIEHLMEDRAALTSQLHDLRNSSDADLKDISAIEDTIETRNAQISDLQERVLASDIESKIKAITDGVLSIPECRAVLKHLLQALIDLRKEYVAKSYKCDVLKSSCELAEDRVAELQNELDCRELRYKQEMSMIQNEYELKIRVLLRELNSLPKPKDFCESTEMTESQKIQEEQLDQLEAMREELEYYKKLCAEVECTRPKHKALRKVEKEVEEILSVSSSSFTGTDDEPFLDDSDRDPDWIAPLKARNTSGNNSRGSKRGSDGSIRCNCKGKCNRRVCGCRKASVSCSENCKCSEICENHIKDEEISLEANGTALLSIANETIVKGTCQKSILSPEKMIEDIETPNYPFAKKKRKPFCI